MAPSGARRYDSTAPKASRSMSVGVAAITYQSPMKRPRSTLAASGKGRSGADWQAASSRAARGAMSVLMVSVQFVAQQPAAVGGRFEGDPFVAGVPEVDGQARRGDAVVACVGRAPAHGAPLVA